MKRRRESMEKGSEIKSAIEELSMVVLKLQPHHLHDADVHVHDHDHDHQDPHIPTKPFLFVCSLLLQVLDKIGPTMAVLRQDIHQNIQRLEKLYESEPSRFSNLVEILKEESTQGTSRTNTSCSRGLVWLTRSMDFTLALLQRLAKDEPCQSMEQAVEESYNMTLKPWHRWISSAAYKVALKLVPDVKTFMDLLTAKGENRETVKKDILTLNSLLVPLLEQTHSSLRFYNLDELKST